MLELTFPFFFLLGILLVTYQSQVKYILYHLYLLNHISFSIYDLCEKYLLKVVRISLAQNHLICK